MQRIWRITTKRIRKPPDLPGISSSGSGVFGDTVFQAYVKIRRSGRRDYSPSLETLITGLLRRGAQELIYQSVAAE